MNADIIIYYKDRANEYEKIYHKPERQEDLLHVSKILQDIFSGKSALEIACGTGYWTLILSKTARSILATDINDSVIEVAKLKEYAPASVTFQKADLFNLQLDNKYESLFGGFIWSHIKLQDLNSFIDIVNSHVGANGAVVFIDNNYVEGSNLPIAETDDFGNTYQIRSLENETKHKVLKNFPTESFFRQLLANKVREINFINLQHYWILRYTIG